MAKFTSSAPLNIRWNGLDLSGPAGTLHRIPDAYYEEFSGQFTSSIPGLTWTDTDETDSLVTLPIGQVDVTGLTAALAAKFPSAGGIISGATTVSTSVTTPALVASSGVTTPILAAQGRPWFDVRAYGAVANGSTDDRAAIQSALDAANSAGGGTVFIPAGTYRINSGALSVYSNTTVQGEKGRSILALDQTSYALYAAGSLGTLVTLNANVTRGANSIVLTASASGYAEDDLVWLQSEAVPFSTGSHKKAEIGVVLSATGSTITLVGRTLDIYNTADSAKAAEITPVRDVHIRDLTIYNDKYSATTTATSPLIGFDFGQRVSVVGCRLYKNNSFGIMFRNTIDFVASDNTISKLRDDDANGIYGYGVCPGGAAANGVVANNVMRECRHGFTTGTGASGPTPNYGVTRTVSVIGNSLQNCGVAALDTHEDAQNITFASNAISGGDYIGIQVRGWDCTVTGNSVFGVRGIGIYIRGMVQDCTVTGNEVAYIGQNPVSAIQGYGLYIDPIRGAVVTGNLVHDCAGSGVYISTVLGAVVTGNYIANNGQSLTGDGVQVDAAISRLILTGNVITDSQTTKTQRYGVRFEAAVVNSDRIVMVGNVISNHATGEFSNAGTGTPQTWANGDNDGPGHTQRTRVTTGSIAAATSSSITVSWPSAFADSNYTITAECLEANGDLRIKNIISQTTGSCVIRVTNDNGASARTGTIHAVAVHD